MLELSSKTNLLEENDYRYSLQDVKDPVLYRDVYNYDAESKNPKDDTELFNRCSYNFTLVIYDTDERMLYFIYYDT